jgi:hypothetical protein
MTGQSTTFDNNSMNFYAEFSRHLAALVIK